MRFTDEHLQLRRTVREFAEKDINPYLDAWEREGAFPAHKVFKKAGRLGLLEELGRGFRSAAGKQTAHDLGAIAQVLPLQGGCRAKLDP